MRPFAVLAALLAAALALAGCTTGPFADRVSQPGSAARELVDPRLHANLVVEIDYPAGHGPNAEAKAVLKSTLQEVTGRSASQVTLVEDASIPAEAGRKYTYEEIEELEARHRNRNTAGDTAVLYILYLAGGSSADTDESRVLGAAYRGTSLVIFKGNIQDATGAIGQPEERYVERAVLVHEFGHAAGLVNLGTEMQTPHEDASHPKHSSNRESVMYWAVETTAGLVEFVTCVAGLSCGANIPYQFDENDKRDLRALRGA